MSRLEELLKDSTQYTHLNGKDVRLYWQEDLTEIVKNYPLLDKKKYQAGWKVITWGRSKVIELYHGANLTKAIKIFRENNK